MKIKHVTPSLRYEDKTFQLRLDVAWRELLLQERAMKDKPMKRIVEEILIDYFNIDPSEERVF